MGVQHHHFLACKTLASFLTDYIKIIEMQLSESRQVMMDTISKIMETIVDLSTETEDKKKEANEILNKIFLEPDKEMADVIASTQKNVDDIFESVNENSDDNSQILENKARRMGSKFTKHMEAIATIDDKLKNIIFHMTGTLSSDDQIGQKLEHLITSLHSLQISLNYILVDLHGRLNSEYIARFKLDLLNYTYKQYTTQEERDIFIKNFPDFKAS
jgi:dsDNA-specific endonuclease/ATPase MutS2